jgi:hypothetical protein
VLQNGNSAAELMWDPSSTLLRADSQSSVQLQQLLQLSTQQQQQQQQQQQYNMLLSYSADTAAAEQQWLELQANQPAAAAAAGYADSSMGINDSGRLSLLLAAATRQLSLDSNSVISATAVTGADVLQVGSYSGSVDCSNSMVGAPTWLAGQTTLAAVSDCVQPQLSSQLYQFGATSMPPAFPTQTASLMNGFDISSTSMATGVATGVVGLPAAASVSWSNQLLGSAGSAGRGVAAMAVGDSNVSGGAGGQTLCCGVHAF